MKPELAKARLTTLALLALNAVLLGFALLRIGLGTQTASILATVPLTAAAPKIGLEEHSRPLNLSLLQEQSLFHASRHFFVPAGADPIAPPPLDYRLAGTFIVPGKPAVAFLALANDGASKKVRTGDSLDGWQVRSVERGRVVLASSGREIEIASVSKGQKGSMHSVSAPLQPMPPQAPGAIRMLDSSGSSLSVISPQAIPDADPSRTPPR